MQEISKLDQKIIQLLYEDGRISVTEVAKRINASRPTVTKHLQQLRESQIILIKGGLNLQAFGYRIASVGLEVRNEDTRKDVEQYLRNCPRILAIYRTPGKANIHLEVWGEDDQTLTSTIESFRDRSNVDIIYTHALGTPIHGTRIVTLVSESKDTTPCGMDCAECHRYHNKWCVGCPQSIHYKHASS
jgi:Lrp/AsnC family leucine-responsive transcriptional regulator